MGMLKLGIIAALAALHVLALMYTLLVWKPNPNTPFMFFAISTIIFMCFCVDLARDQLQNIAYFPVTNTIFLITFTISCIVSKIKQFKAYWPIIQLASLIYYILHEQYSLRQILYWILENDQTFKGLTLISFGLVSCVVIHFGCGTMIRKLLDKKRSQAYMGDFNDQLEEIALEQDNISLKTQSQKYLDHQDNQDQSKLINIFQQNKQLPELIKAVAILLPPLIDFLSFIWQLFSSESSHSHGHTHTHVYFAEEKLYFKDETSEPYLLMFFFALRIISSAVIFHYFFTLWNEMLEGLNTEKMKEKYKLIMGGFILAVCRLLAERL